VAPVVFHNIEKKKIVLRKRFHSYFYTVSIFIYSIRCTFYIPVRFQDSFIKCGVEASDKKKWPSINNNRQFIVVASSVPEAHKILKRFDPPQSRASDSLLSRA
jgi:hypothetical protein